MPWAFISNLDFDFNFNFQRLDLGFIPAYVVSKRTVKRANFRTLSSSRKGNKWILCGTRTHVKVALYSPTIQLPLLLDRKSSAILDWRITRVDVYKIWPIYHGNVGKGVSQGYQKGSRTRVERAFWNGIWLGNTSKDKNSLLWEARGVSGWQDLKSNGFFRERKPFKS